MSALSHLRKLYAYNAWATGETIASLEQAGAANEHTLKLLAHIIIAQELWLARIEARTLTGFSSWPVWSLDECRSRARAIATTWEKYFGSLTEERLASGVSYRNIEGKEFTNVVENILTHVVNHSTYHRGQIASLVRAGGAKPAVTDFIAYARK